MKVPFSKKRTLVVFIRLTKELEISGYPGVIYFVTTRKCSSSAMIFCGDDLTRIR